MTLRAAAVLLIVSAAAGPVRAQSKKDPVDKFRQLEELLPTPNEFRTASGAPGPRYWQQRADYVIDVELDDDKRRILGQETVTYRNQSPDPLTYLWLQLDQNIFEKGSDANLSQTAPRFLPGRPVDQEEFAGPRGPKPPDRISYTQLDGLLAAREFDGGMRIGAVRDARGEALPHTIVKTMMRIDLKTALAPGQSFVFSVEWSYPINDAKRIRARSGYELFPKDGNAVYEIAQWFPRLAAYTDVNGWQHKQFLGSGEFTLEFGDYLVRITAPDDHVVGASGVLQNPLQVLSVAQRQRLEQAKTAKAPVYVVTPDEARAAEAGKPGGKKTWVFKADNVRDFAFASSRKFIWDAQGHTVDGRSVMAMSYYPKEGRPLWDKYSTPAIIHTLNVYSRYSFTYPYPVAISVNGPVGGMEYPMICFNGPRPEEDGTYAPRAKYGLVSVVIHEVGHNFFPMTVNSDERQWTWMDEGINTFLQYLSEQEWEKDYPSRRGEPKEIVEYMTSAEQVPIMTNSESLLQFGNNAYAKPATALNILRETVLGRELFDFAFKEYARRWKFKRPEPADFFRTLEDASGVDLDWFWRGWFYTTDHVDVAIEKVRLLRLETKDPEVDKKAGKAEREAQPRTLAQERNQALPKRVEQVPSLADFYNTYDELVVTEGDRDKYQKFLKGLEEKEKGLLKTPLNFYMVDLRNVGGLVMPVILQVDYADGSSEELRIPAEVWRYNHTLAKKLLLTEKEIRSLVLDPHLETADADLDNNAWPPRPAKSRFQLFKDEKRLNPMQELEKKGPADPPTP